jgi:hypothetical protein
MVIADCLIRLREGRQGDPDGTTEADVIKCLIRLWDDKGCQWVGQEQFFPGFALKPAAKSKIPSLGASTVRVGI